MGSQIPRVRKSVCCKRLDLSRVHSLSTANEVNAREEEEEDNLPHPGLDGIDIPRCHPSNPIPS